MAWEPGNPKGWGDPGPLVIAVLLLVILGALLDRYSNYTAFQQRCIDVTEQGR